MEVHAHPHPAPGGTRKRWRHYLWEFLMLFLAVFCGFLAENIREHKVEKQRAKQYVRSFYEDLKTDTGYFTVLINYYKEKNAVLAQKADCFDTISRDIRSTACLDRLFENSENFPDFVYTDRTLQQLKNAGGLRLLDEEDADSISIYDSMLRHYVMAETTSFQETQTNLRNTLYSLINYNRIKRDSVPAGVPLLYNDNKDLLNRCFNELHIYAVYCNDNLSDITNIQSEAIVLLRYFKEKYHLK